MIQPLIYPGSSSFFPGQTPFGIYDNDYVFGDDAPKVALWCARRLGYPIQNVELIDENFYACFEEAASEYSAQVNQFNIRNNLTSLLGKATGTPKKWFKELIYHIWLVLLILMELCVSHLTAY